MITKKKIRVRVQNVLRRSYLLKPAEELRYWYNVMRLKKRNRKFTKDHPDFCLPPEYLAFDAYSSSHWEFYKVSGEITARFLGEIIKKHFSQEDPLKRIYEWGCGPARIIRQLPLVLEENISYYASDYNEESIEWCKEHIEGIEFFKNELMPPLAITDGYFDFIFVVSVFTHLSEVNGKLWAEELYRILRPGGVMLITTLGERTYSKELLEGERKKYEEKGIVVRDRYEEGKKMFLTIHNPDYVELNLLKKFQMLKHTPDGFPFMKQDYWVVKKG